MQKGCIINLFTAYCIFALPCKNLDRNFSRVFREKTVLFWQYLCQFSKFHNFCKNRTSQLLLTSFVSADVGNQHEVMPNAMVADDALINYVPWHIVHVRWQQC